MSVLQQMSVFVDLLPHVKRAQLLNNCRMVGWDSGLWERAHDSLRPRVPLHCQRAAARRCQAGGCQARPSPCILMSLTALCMAVVCAGTGGARWCSKVTLADGPVRCS